MKLKKKSILKIKIKRIMTKSEIKTKWNQMIGTRLEKNNLQKKRWKSKEWGLHYILKTNERKLV